MQQGSGYFPTEVLAEAENEFIAEPTLPAAPPPVAMLPTAPSRALPTHKAPPRLPPLLQSSSSSRLPSPSLRQQQAESRPALMRAPSAPASNLVPPNLVPARSLARLPSNDGEPGPPQLPRALPPRLVAPAAFRHAPAGAQTQHRAPPPPRVHRAPPNPAIRAVPPSMPRAHPPP